ncbi:MAG: hemolysin III family protein [Pseudomonadota bacterium]
MAYLYTRPERMADGTIHLLGLAASIIATVLLILFAARTGSGLDVAAVSVYGGVAIFAFAASAAYHMTPWSRARSWLQRVDHAAIYLMIAGTYTPLVVVLGSVFAYVVLGLIWTVAVLGALGKLTQILQPGWASTFLYIAMGWASVVLIWPLVQTVPPLTLWLMLAGGLAYTIGAPINHWEDLRFNVAIWHGFVLAGYGLFLGAIVVALMAA